MDDHGRHWAAGFQRGCIGACGVPALLGYRRWCKVGEGEAPRELEVELDGCRLVLLVGAVGCEDVNLGAVESPVTGVERPGVPGEGEGGFEGCFGEVPFGEGADVVWRSCGEDEDGRGKVEDVVDGGDELERGGDLRGDLGRAAEDVGIVLVEATHSGEAAEGARSLVPVV